MTKLAYRKYTEKHVHRCVTLPKSLDDKLRVEATKQGKSYSEYARELIYKSLENN